MFLFTAQVFVDFSKQNVNDSSELLLSLNYLSQAERLVLSIMRARNLRTDKHTRVKVNMLVSRLGPVARTGVSHIEL